MPNAPEVSELLGDAASRLSEVTGRSQIDGYQSGPERVGVIVDAVYEAVCDWHVRYSEPPASWVDEGQKIRMPADLHGTRLGTCLDTTLLFAAALEQAGIRPLVWMLTGHGAIHPRIGCSSSSAPSRSRMPCVRSRGCPEGSRSTS